MTTAVAPWDAFDAKLRKNYRLQDASAQFLRLEGTSQDYLRELLTTTDVAAVEARNLNSLITDMGAQIDAAVAKHQATTRALQAELANSATETERRVECRRLVIEANAELAQTIEPLKESIEAAKYELQIARATASGRTVIENAFVAAAPPEVRERLRAIEKVLNVADSFLISRLKDKASRSQNELDVLRARQSEEDERRRWRFDSAIADAERVANHDAAVLAIARGWISQAEDEKLAIRRQQLQNLYR